MYFEKKKIIGLANLLSDKNIKFSKLMLPSVQVAKKADAVKAEARGRMGERWEESATIKKEKATVSFRFVGKPVSSMKLAPKDINIIAVNVVVDDDVFIANVKGNNTSNNRRSPLSWGSG